MIIILALKKSSSWKPYYLVVHTFKFISKNIFSLLALSEQSIKCKTLHKRSFLLNWMYKLFMEKTKKYYARYMIFYVGPKRWKLHFLAFFAHSYEMQNLFGRWHFQDLFYRLIQKSKNIACIMSQSVIKLHIKNVVPYSGRNHVVYLWFWILMYTSKVTSRWAVFPQDPPAYVLKSSCANFHSTVTKSVTVLFVQPRLHWIC